jgi:tricarballylate dehydrogenase
MSNTVSLNSLGYGGPWDLIIVGHGAAGISAALSYLESLPESTVARVAVLDRATEEKRGGSTAWTTAGLRIDDDQQLDPGWQKLVRETSGHLVNEPYIEAFYENAIDTLNWIRRRGVKTLNVPAPVPTAFGKRVWFIEGGGRAIIDILTPLVTEAGATIFYETAAKDLITDASGAITGLVVHDSDGNPHTMATSAVLLACGGFEANPEMLSRYIPNAHRLKTVSPGTMANKGDGIRMAVAVGADTSGQFDRAHLEPVDPRSDNWEALISSYLVGILVNDKGERFCDETQWPHDIGFDVVANEIHLQPGGRAYAITDAGGRESAPMLAALNLTEHAPVRADSIEELAEKLGISSAALANTVARFNSATSVGAIDPSCYDGKATVGLQPPKTHWAQPLQTPPFEAYPVVPHICFTFGGVRVDGETRVLDPEGQAIPGLFAAGEITGAFYDVYPSGTSVWRSLTFGKIAGTVLAQATAAAKAVEEVAVS